MRLSIEFVPESSWFQNLKSKLPKDKWDKIRRYAYKKYNYKCAVCGGKGEKWPVEAHEIWEYDDDEHIQKLVDVIALCPKCYLAKHIGLAQIKGKYDEALQHLADINGWSIDKAENYIMEQVAIWEERSKYDWKIDLSYLDSIFQD